MIGSLIDLPSLLTVTSAIDLLLQDLDEERLSVIRATEYDDRIENHFGVGLLIRNIFSLHHNPVLVGETGTTNADDASL